MLEDALLPLLPSLIALVEEGGVTRAARRLGISQSRMSARLAELRQRLGDPVLITAAGRRGLLPTDRATSLADAAKAALTGLHYALADESFEPTKATRTFRIMASDAAMIIVGADLVSAIRAQGAAGVSVAFLAFERNRLGELEAGALDLVIGRPHQLRKATGLRSRVIARESYVTITKSNDPAEKMDIDAFCRREHLLISTYPEVFRGKVDDELEKLGRRRTIAVSVPNHLAAVSLVATSELIATLPRAIALRRAVEVKLFDPPLAFESFTLSAAWHERRANDPAHRWLRALLPTVTPASLISA